MTTRHQHMRARDSSDKKKSADALRAEFFAHRCTESCLILMSEATVAGFSPMSLSIAEVRECTIMGPSPRKEKPRPHLAMLTRSRAYPSRRLQLVVFSQLCCLSEKDQTVREWRESSNNDSLKQFPAEDSFKLPAVQGEDPSCCETWLKNRWQAHTYTHLYS